MLLNLHIVNMALIDELDIDFYDGLNIMTGETGAGKSIIVGSIGIGLGGKFDQSLLRKPEKEGLVELLFSVTDSLSYKLKELGIDVSEEDNQVIIQRRCVGQRTVTRINGKTVTVAVLKEVAGLLLNLHAQHEQRTLTSPAKHLELVDNFGAQKYNITDIKTKVKKAYDEYTSLVKELGSMQLDEAERAKRLDFIEFEISEIEAARLKVGEDAMLEELFTKQQNAESIIEITEEVHGVTGYDSDKSAGNQLSRAVRAVSMLSKYDDSKETEDLINSLSDIESLVNDFNRNLAAYMAEMDFSEAEFAETSSRLDLINSLKTKYGTQIEDILNTHDALVKERDELSDFDANLARLESEKNQKEKELMKLSDELSEVRKKSSKELCHVIEESLKSLNFNAIKFEMSFEKEDKYSQNGYDKAEFMISTNIGEPVRPLATATSGGELSRVMLSIKSVLSETGDTPTLIFDEIDTGISGITAQKVGEMMHNLSKTHQIISITHLPQIAVQADSSYLIEKIVSDDKTHTNIRKLTDEEKVYEIARLLSGDMVTDSVLSSARELLMNYTK